MDEGANVPPRKEVTQSFSSVKVRSEDHKNVI